MSVTASCSAATLRPETPVAYQGNGADPSPSGPGMQLLLPPQSPRSEGLAGVAAAAATPHPRPLQCLRCSPPRVYSRPALPRMQCPAPGL